MTTPDIPADTEREYVPTLAERIAEAIPTELTATPHVGIGGARRAKIAAAVLPVVEAELAKWSPLMGAWMDSENALNRELTTARAELEQAQQQLATPVRVLVVLDAVRGRIHSITASDDEARRHVRELVAKHNGPNHAATMTVGLVDRPAAVPAAPVPVTPASACTGCGLPLASHAYTECTNALAAPVPASADEKWRPYAGEPVCRPPCRRESPRPFRESSSCATRGTASPTPRPLWSSRPTCPGRHGMTAELPVAQATLDAAAEASLVNRARALYAWQARIDLLREVDRLRTETAAAIEQARADGAAAERERIEREVFPLVMAARVSLSKGCMCDYYYGADGCTGRGDCWSPMAWTLNPADVRAAIARAGTSGGGS